MFICFINSINVCIWKSYEMFNVVLYDEINWEIGGPNFKHCFIYLLTSLISHIYGLKLAGNI